MSLMRICWYTKWEYWTLTITKSVQLPKVSNTPNVCWLLTTHSYFSLLFPVSRERLSRQVPVLRESCQSTSLYLHVLQEQLLLLMFQSLQMIQKLLPSVPVDVRNRQINIKGFLRLLLLLLSSGSKFCWHFNFVSLIKKERQKLLQIAMITSQIL